MEILEIKITFISRKRCETGPWIQILRSDKITSTIYILCVVG